MNCIILLLILILILILLICSQFIQNIEYLDNCDAPPIKGSTSTDITNSNEIATLQQQVSDLDSHLRQQVYINTSQINTINSNIQDLNSLRQTVADLSLSIKNTEQGIQKLRQYLQTHNSGVSNNSK